MSSIYQQAILSLEQGHLDRAERQFRIVLQDDPEISIEVMGHLADIALMKDNIHSVIDQKYKYKQSIKRKKN